MNLLFEFALSATSELDGQLRGVLVLAIPAAAVLLAAWAATHAILRVEGASTTRRRVQEKNPRALLETASEAALVAQPAFRWSLLVVIAATLLTAGSLSIADTADIEWIADIGDKAEEFAFRAEKGLAE